MKQETRTIALFGVALGAAFFLLYAFTAAPSIVELYDDTLEFQLVGPTFGIAHPTGYPLYTLLGGLWSRLLLPVGNWAWRMNLLSALAAGATMGVLCWLTQRIATETLAKAQSAQSGASEIVSSDIETPQSATGSQRGRLTRLQTEDDTAAQPRRLVNVMPGLVAAVAFGLGPVWWSQATVAEVYALHNLLVIVAIGLAFVIGKASTSKVTTATLLFLTLGLGLAHHRTIALVVPGLMVMVWGRSWLWRPSRYWVRWGVALLAPLLLYLYIPLRATMGVRDLNGSYEQSWAGFWHHVLALGYTGFFTENTLTRQLTAGGWLELWVAQIGWVGIGLGLLGAGWWFWRGPKRQLGLGLLVILLTNALFAMRYRVGDPEVFMLPAWLLFALFAGMGVVALRQIPGIPRPMGRALQALSLFVILIGGGGRGPAVDRSQDWAAHDYAIAMAKVDFPPDSQVIGLEGQITALRYMQQAERLGLNATGVVANTPAERLAAISSWDELLPLYLTQEVEGIADLYRFSGEGPLVRVWPLGAAVIQTPAHQLSESLIDDNLLLTGYDLSVQAEAGGPTLEVVLYWQPTQPLDAVYKLSLRLQDGTGTPVHWPAGDAVTADRYPLHQVARTDQWRPGEPIRDVHRFRIPKRALTATSELLIILYDAETVAEVGRVVLPVR